MNRLCEALSAFWQILSTGELKKQDSIVPEEKPTTEEPMRRSETDAISKFNDGAVYTLVLLQRDGRLVDFLREDISNYSNDQIGMAVRQIHEGCGTVLDKHFGIEPVTSVKEGESMTIEENYDPLKIMLSGNISDKFPLNGKIKHQGWKAANISFPTFSGKRDPMIIQSGEVEI